MSIVRSSTQAGDSCQSNVYCVWPMAMVAQSARNSNIIVRDSASEGSIRFGMLWFRQQTLMNCTIFNEVLSLISRSSSTKWYFSMFCKIFCSKSIEAWKSVSGNRFTHWSDPPQPKCQVLGCRRDSNLARDRNLILESEWKKFQNWLAVQELLEFAKLAEYFLRSWTKLKQMYTAIFNHIDTNSCGFTKQVSHKTSNSQQSSHN